MTRNVLSMQRAKIGRPVRRSVLEAALRGLKELAA